MYRVLFSGMIVLAGVSAAFDVSAGTYKKYFLDEDGGGWAMITDETDWGGPSRSRVTVNENGAINTYIDENSATQNVFPDPDTSTTDNNFDEGFMWGPGHEPSPNFSHSWGIFKFDLTALIGTNNRATTDGVIRFDNWWNHYNDNWEHQVSGDAPPYWADSIALYEIPAGKMTNSNAGPGTSSSDAAGYRHAFRHASLNSVTSNQTDTAWLPTAENPGTPLSLWDGVLANGGGVNYIEFVIPKEVINGWIDDPSSYHGLILAGLGGQDVNGDYFDEQFRNGGVWVEHGRTSNLTSGANFLTFEFDVVPEPASVGLFGLAAFTLLRRRPARRL